MSGIKIYEKLTKADLPNIVIAEDFVDFYKYGFGGPYKEVPATDTCPRLFYCNGKCYAQEHDLIGFNLISSSDIVSQVIENTGDIKQLQEIALDHEDRIQSLEEVCPTPPPTPGPDPTPEFKNSKIDRDQDLIGGKDLKKVIDGGIMILSGTIKRYDADYQFPVDGNYVGCTITPDPTTWSHFACHPIVIYKGMTYNANDIFDSDGTLTLYINVKVPGQETPIDIRWNQCIIEHFVVAISQESKFL